jgi:hypothetical protein
MRCQDVGQVGGLNGTGKILVRCHKKALRLMPLCASNMADLGFEAPVQHERRYLRCDYCTWVISVWLETVTSGTHIT